MKRVLAFFANAIVAVAILQLIPHPAWGACSGASSRAPLLCKDDNKLMLNQLPGTMLAGAGITLGTGTTTSTATGSASATASATGWATATGSTTSAVVGTGTRSGSETHSQTFVNSNIYTSTYTDSDTNTDSHTITSTSSYTWSGTATVTMSNVGTVTGTTSATVTVTGSIPVTGVITVSGTGTATSTVSFAATKTEFGTPTATATWASTAPITATVTATGYGTASHTGTRTVTGTGSGTYTWNGTAERTTTITETASATYAVSEAAAVPATDTLTASATGAATATFTNTNTSTNTATSCLLNTARGCEIINTIGEGVLAGSGFGTYLARWGTGTATSVATNLSAALISVSSTQATVHGNLAFDDGQASGNFEAIGSITGGNITATPTASKIPVADGSGKLDGWITQQLKAVLAVTNASTVTTDSGGAWTDVATTTTNGQGGQVMMWGSAKLGPSTTTCCYARLTVDGTQFGAELQFCQSTYASLSPIGAAFSLTAATHTIKLQARSTTSTTCSVSAGESSLMVLHTVSL